MRDGPRAERLDQRGIDPVPLVPGDVQAAGLPGNVGDAEAAWEIGVNRFVGLVR